jgi:hypothetical protein
MGAISLAMLAGIAVPLLIWAAIITVLRHMFIEWRTMRSGLLSGNLACSLDADCPPGYRCVGGRCVLATSR